ncbi:MAG: hypothetical protein MZV64_17540 [Ignavibacteriales bacterium]|nr:hypothetical protein [Ignavibacteriales bacterium]
MDPARFSGGLCKSQGTVMAGIFRLCPERRLLALDRGDRHQPVARTDGPGDHR